MSLRSIHLYGANNGSSVLIESTNNEKCLLLQQSGIIECDKTLGNTLKSNYHKILDGFALLGILKLTEDLEYLALVTGVLSVGQLYNSDIYKISNVQFVPLNAKIDEPIDQRIIELQKLLSSGIFYFSNSADRQNCFNLSVSLQQKRNNQNSTPAADFRFYWNRNLTFPFDRYNIEPNDWCVKCICGSVLIRTIYLGHRTAKVAIISRLSCEHVGTRFNVRGINDEGNVANFVETEQIVIFEEQECSFLQIRGSIPLFWEQPGINVGSHVVKMKPLELSLVALERHFTRLKRFYGKILSVNLLSSKKGEFVLSNAFKSALKSSTHGVNVRLVSFDYHAEVKQSKESVKRLIKDISAYIDECNFFHQNGQNQISQQTGVIRTNCLDCLDRTNSVQTLIGMRAIVAQLTELGVEQYKANIVTRVEEIIREMWQRNGDQCSVIYAGTGALEGKSKLKDASRSIVRTIQNNLMDSAKQESFDLLLFGRLFGQRQFDKLFSLLPTNLLRANSYFFECPNLDEFVEREKEMCVPISLKIFAGTWNVNGGKNIYNVAYKDNNSLGPWIFPTNLLDIESLNYDLIGIGLEEIVDLNASNLVKASTTNQRIWCSGIKRIIDEFQREHFGEKAENFVVLCCEQLVGVCLILFVRSSLLASVKDVAIGEVKTGMGGATGNKGSIAVRMTINSTSVCFVCSHFAAGQNEIAARNSDYLTALKRIRFPMGRTVEQNDAIFWIGDFNYRISLNGEEVKNAIRANEFAYLAENDQLTQQKELGNIFVGFKEGPLHFAPTYKYDTFSDDYDTSEKCRSPAWTDRILWMDQNNLVRLIHYGRSELKTSDHRPVFAIFQLDTLKFDFQKAEPVLKDIIHSIGPPNPTIICSVSGHSQQFPQQFCKEIFSKIFELGSAILVSKIEGQFLHIVLGTGMDALAALSMDGLTLSDGQMLEVKLAPNSAEHWPENVLAELDAAIELAKQEIVAVPSAPIVAELCALNVANNLDGEDSDDDDQCQQNAANGSNRATPIHHNTNAVGTDTDQTIPADFALIDFSDVPTQQF